MLYFYTNAFQEVLFSQGEIKIDGEEHHRLTLRWIAHNSLARVLRKTNIFYQVAVVVKYIRPAALILHPVTLMIQSTQYKY